MWPGLLTPGAHLRDDVSRLDVLADADRVALNVPVDMDGAVTELDPDPQAETAGRACLDHGALGGGTDRGSGGVREVDAVVSGSPSAAECRAELAVGRSHEIGFRRFAGLRRLALFALFRDLVALGQLLRLGLGLVAGGRLLSGGQQGRGAFDGVVSVSANSDGGSRVMSVRQWRHIG